MNAIVPPEILKLRDQRGKVAATDGETPFSAPEGL